MKGKDLILLAGGALLVYMLIPKEKIQAAAGSVTTIPQLIPGPTQVIPQIIPQLIPQIIPQIMPDRGEQGPSEWDIFQMFQGWTEQMDLGLTVDDVEETIQGALNKVLPGGEQQPPRGAEGVGWLDKLLRGETLYPTGIVPSISETITDIIEAPFEVGKEVFDEYGLFSEDWWTSMMPEWALTEAGKAQRAYGAESEAIFELAGVTEATPENIARLIAAEQIIKGKKDEEEIPAIGTPPSLLPY